MSVRKACSTLRRIAPLPPLAEHGAAAAEREWDALEWRGEVRIASDRAAATPAPRFHAHVRTGLLERVLVLGADHCEGPHRQRPEIAGRLLAHFDALSAGYESTLAWLAEQRLRYASGESVDTDVATYTPRPFPLLWEQGQAELRTLADLVGIDALPENVQGWFRPSQTT